MKHIFEEAIASVNAAYPSVYTKEDVIVLIKDIQAGVEDADQARAPFDVVILEGIKQSMLEGVSNIDFENCVALELNYDNRIDIDIDTRAIFKEVEESFDTAVDEIFPKLTPIAPVAGNTQTNQ